MKGKHSQGKIKSLALSSLKYLMAMMMFGAIIFMVVATYVSAG